MQRFLKKIFTKISAEIWTSSQDKVFRENTYVGAENRISQK
jgi:hypothetical protein